MTTFLNILATDATLVFLIIHRPVNNKKIICRELLKIMQGSNKILKILT